MFLHRGEYCVDYHWLIERRKKKGLSQAKLASLIDVHKSYIGKIENGRRPSVEVAKSLASALDFEWTRFYEGNSGD